MLINKIADKTKWTARGGRLQFYKIFYAIKVINNFLPGRNCIFLIQVKYNDKSS
jgi:hypothetical protein